MIVRILGALLFLGVVGWYCYKLAAAHLNTMSVIASLAVFFVGVLSAAASVGALDSLWQHWRTKK